VSVYFSGYTAITPLGTVDMVPFLRRFKGLKDPIPEFELDAGIIALNASGIEGWRIANALHMSAETVNRVLDGTLRHAQPERRKRTNPNKNANHKALLERRHAERVLIDGRLVHPDATHGLNSSYAGYGCRCIPCSAAHTVARRLSYQKKEATA